MIWKDPIPDSDPKPPGLQREAAQILWAAMHVVTPADGGPLSSHGKLGEAISNTETARRMGLSRSLLSKARVFLGKRRITLNLEESLKITTQRDFRQFGTSVPYT